MLHNEAEFGFELIEAVLVGTGTLPPAPSVIPVAPFPTPKASVHCKSKTSRNRGVRAEMGGSSRGAGAKLSALGSAPERRAGSASHLLPDATSPWLSELRRQIWDLPDGRIIFASAILCVCVRVECLGVGAKMGMESRAGSASARAAASSLDPSRGSGQSPGRPAAGSRRSSATPRPYRPRPRGPDARS